MRYLKYNDIFFLLIRITIGFVFIQSGLGKIHNVEKVIDYFKELNIPLPIFSTYLTAWTELIAGIFIFLGFLTRVSSFSIFIIMFVAILTTQLKSFESWTEIFGTIEYLYALMALGLSFIGAEKISLDQAISIQKRSKLR